jgi:hypothetical protein
MKNRTKRALAFVAGSLGALGVVVIKKNLRQRRSEMGQQSNVWARPGMQVTFRAELMPGRNREARTFRIKELLPSGRVILHDASGEHAQKEFEPVHT